MSKDYFMNGVLIRSGMIDRNRMIVSKRVLKKAVRQYNSIHVLNGNAVGEPWHPDIGGYVSDIVNYGNVSHRVVELRWHKSKLLGKIEILDTPSGMVVRKLIDNNVRLGISARFNCQEFHKRKCRELLSMRIIAFDLAQHPADPKCWLRRCEKDA